MKSRLVPLADRLGISGLLKKYPYEVSGGQKQRAAVAARSSRARRFSLPTSRPVRSTPAPPRSCSVSSARSTAGADHRHGHALRPRGQLWGRVLFLRDGAVAQELTRGTDTETAFYRRIADALTASQTGGGAA